MRILRERYVYFTARVNAGSGLELVTCGLGIRGVRLSSAPVTIPLWPVFVANVCCNQCPRDSQKRPYEGRNSRCNYLRPELFSLYGVIPGITQDEKAVVTKSCSQRRRENCQSKERCHYGDPKRFTPITQYYKKRTTATLVDAP